MSGACPHAYVAAFVPLFLLNRLLSQSHILHVLLESVERGIWFYTYTIVMILGVPSATEKTKTKVSTLTESPGELSKNGQMVVNICFEEEEKPTLSQGALYGVP